MIQQAPQDPLETTDDLCRKESWPVEWEQKMAERIETEKVHAAWNQREFRDKAEKKVLKSAKECGTQAKKKMEEEIGKYIGCDEMVTRPI